MTSPIPLPAQDVKIENAGAKKFVSIVKALEGDPYQYGAAGPGSFDCSGLVQYGLEQTGLTNVPRTSEEQWAWIKANGGQINKSQLRPGDLIFSQWPGDNASPGHVQIYLGGGQVLQAPHTGATVSTAALSSDTGHIVGYGRVPFGQIISDTLDKSTSIGGADVGGLIGEAGSLLHGISEMLDFAFGMFAPGQGWRMAFGAGSVVTGYGAVRTYARSGEGSFGGAGFPLAVGLAGLSVLMAFMALRPWPQLAGGPEKPGAYLAEILEGQPPPPGPARVHETNEIEAGLAVFAVAWLTNKAASAVNSVVTGITSALGALGIIAAA